VAMLFFWFLCDITPCERFSRPALWPCLEDPRTCPTVRPPCGFDHSLSHLVFFLTSPLSCRTFSGLNLTPVFFFLPTDSQKKSRCLPWSLVLFDGDYPFSSWPPPISFSCFSFHFRKDWVMLWYSNGPYQKTHFFRPPGIPPGVVPFNGYFFPKVFLSAFRGFPEGLF